MDGYWRLEYRLAGAVLVARPLPRVIGPWDGADEPPVEALEFRDQLTRLLREQCGPLLLDLTGYEFARNWNWFLVPLVRDCRAEGRPLAAWVGSQVAEQFAVTRLDRLLPIRTTFDAAVAALGRQDGPAEPDAADVT